MRHADEVIPLESIEEIPRGDDIAPSQKELDMARQLIEALSGDFEPEKYTDAYREQLLEIIEKKATGEEIVAAPLVEEPAKVVDLMAAPRRAWRARARAGTRPRAVEGGGEEDQEGRRQESHEGDEDPLALAQVRIGRLRSQPLRQGHAAARKLGDLGAAGLDRAGVVVLEPSAVAARRPGCARFEVERRARLLPYRRSLVRGLCVRCHRCHRRRPGHRVLRGLLHPPGASNHGGMTATSS